MMSSRQRPTCSTAFSDDVAAPWAAACSLSQRPEGHESRSEMTGPERRGPIRRSAFGGVERDSSGM